jgi:hypothetical protein
MITIDQAIAKLERLGDMLPDVVQQSIEVSAFDAIEKIQSRVVETGKDAKGNPFDDYTDQYKIYKANYKAINQKRETNKKRKERAEIQQEDFVRARFKKKLEVPTGPKGRYKGYVDYDLTGDLWRNIGLVEKKTTDSGSRLAIGPRTEVNEKKIEGNKRGTPLRASTQEKSQVRESFKKRTIEQIKRLLK